MYARWRALGARGQGRPRDRACARRARRAAIRARSRSAAATARCCASCTAAASAARSRAWRSPRRRSRSRAARPEIESVELYDGRAPAGRRRRVRAGHPLARARARPRPGGAAQQRSPAPAGRCVVEVPLEANWSARRAGKREHAAEVGHLQRLDRARRARSRRAPACRSPPSSRTRCRSRSTASSRPRARRARRRDRQVGGARRRSPPRPSRWRGGRSRCTTRAVPRRRRV